MQSINQPQAALLAGMQQGQNPMMQQGFMGGGLASLRPGYMGGGAIGGGIIHGTPMGSRTGYWSPKKWLKKKVKQAKNIATKLTPKELAPAMTWAAPFMGPIAGPIMGGLGSLKMHGKLDPKIMAMSILPHMRFGMPQSMGGSGMGYGKWGGGSSLRNLLTGKGVGSSKGILNTKFGDFGTQLDANLFGKAPSVQRSMSQDGLRTSVIPGKKGLFMDLQGGALPKGQGSFGEIFKTLANARGGGAKGKYEVISSILVASNSYSDALEMANRAGVGDSMPGSEAEYNEWRDKINDQTQDFWKGTEAENYRTGGRVGYAMGSAQFPPNRRVYADGGRSGLQWGSDKGEGLGGEEVEADMRYEGGFMPYGEEPKADDVPARLSKDEFVFTDGAVAGAGDGDIELGAERLYNVMKNLEQGGRLSEETQGEAGMVGQGLGLEREMGQGIGAII